ncbi:glycosyltransferase [Desulfosporosinus sp. SYSU MS00001]|uniref:glycosyltransferase n=1 Tax=Desulfosporosinus sp. SYSU MS00001 TaxID=3416284 RepID=UPI003CF93889
MITLSVCMIVRNEEQLIARCLNCINEIADEIVIVDTGSVDNTKEIARQYTSKIYDFEWIDDFSAARNFSFSKATMDYIYAADADELIDENNREKFKRLKSTLDTDVEIVEMKYGNQLEKGSTYNFDVEYRPKLFKRVRSFKWIDPIHEIVDCRLNSMKSDILITHKPLTSHASRDLTHLQNLTAKNTVLNSRLHMMYARELLIAGTEEDFYNAFEYFNRSLPTMNKDDIRLSHCVLARYYNLKSDSYNLFKIAAKNIQGAASAEICCELGSYYMKENDYNEAVYWYYTAATAASADLSINYVQFIPNLQLCRCFLELGDLAEAAKYNDMAGIYKPDSPEVAANRELLST